MSVCYECRKKLNHKRKDNGSYTARVWKCDECKEYKPILPDRHWIIPNK